MEKLYIVIPAYNEQDTIEAVAREWHPIVEKYGDNSRLVIINDGSKDNTGAIADSYAEKYPDTVKVIHQQNGGHGAGVNAGLAAATGTYFKVVDSDDWVDESALFKALSTLKQYLESENPIDLLIANYVYEHVEDNTQNIIHYRGVFPKNRMFGWDEMIKINPIRYIIMHSVIYKTDILRKSGIKLPEHTFYVDNLVLYVPLQLTEKLYYLDVDFYRYYTGRADQSVNEKVMVGRIDQQIFVTNMLLDSCDLNEIDKKSHKLAKYLRYYLSVMYTITAALFALAKDSQPDSKRVELWTKLKNTDKKLYIRIRYFSKAFFMGLPGKAGKSVSRFIYRIARKVYKFN
jgi:glycosyltransferase involved in cell wall biosynthesis